MLCPSCKTDNPSDAAFCEQCGSKLEPICPACKAKVNSGARFCRKCGTAVGSVAAPPLKKSNDERIRVADVSASENLEGERKTVTVLFADITGSMDLIEDLDPEDARTLVDPALKLMMEAVQHYGGYVAQPTGDGIFALFGAPIAHEDDPQRALYAALRMQEELKRYSDRIRASGRLPIQARVGVNTGEVVVRSIATGEGRTEYVPVGHSTGIAARMQALAPVGSIAATEPVRKLCEGYFVFKSMGPTKVKGVGEPVNVYEVTGLGPLRTRLQRAAGRGLTKFVGREREIDVLQHAAELTQDGRGQVVAAVAMAGVGKSRLFHEFKARNQSGWMVLEAVSFLHGKASAYLPVLDLLHSYFAIEAGDDARRRREKVNGKVLTLERTLEDTLPYLLALLGLIEGDDALAGIDGQLRRRYTLEAIKRLLLRESLSQPLMVLFEDLQWIDEETQAFLNLFADSIGTSKILLLINYRPEYSHQWGSKTYYTQLRLDPLGKESAEEMLSALLGEGQDLIPLKHMIIERTEGTPFFMEEMVQALFEDGVLKRNGAVKLARPINTVKVPATVQAVLASRIDRLPLEEREVLQTLAVLGREFPVGLAQRLTLRGVDELERMLSRLQVGEFISEQPTARDIEYAFVHALTQEVAYKTLLVERRKQLHERAGQALEAMFCEQLEDHLDELALHYSRSDNCGKAVEYLGRAGQQALQRSAYSNAISSLSDATNLLHGLPDGPDRVRRELLLQLAVGPAFIAVKGYAAPEVERAYNRARELCERLGDPPELFPALLGLFLHHLERGTLKTAHELGERLLRLGENSHDPTLLTYAQMALGETSFWMGEFLTARKHLDTAISLYDLERHRPFMSRYGAADPGVLCLAHAAWTLWQLGYPEQSLRRGDQALALAQALSHPYSLALARLFVGAVRQYRREISAAQEDAEGVIALSAEHGFSLVLAYGTILHGCAVSQQGRAKEGIAQMQEGLAASRGKGAEEARPYFLCLLAEACMETGRFDDGLKVLTEALAAADELGNRCYEAEAHRLKGELLLKQDGSKTTQAHSCFQRATEIARKQHAKSWELRASTSLARLLAKQGKRDEARAMLGDIYNWFTEGFDLPDLKDAKALLDELGN